MRSLGTLLRVGVMLAALVVLIGGVFYLVSDCPANPDYRVFRAQPFHLASVLRLAGACNGPAIIQIGIVLLIATPIMRVASAGFLFARRRDYRYTAIALIVLGALAYSVFAAH
jgi:uncharacterized membrane protein